MTDLDEQVRLVRERIAAAQRARARAEHDRDAAKARADQAAATLRAEFGVSTVDDAKARLADLTAELTATLDALRADLDAIGA